MLKDTKIYFYIWKKLFLIIGYIFNIKSDLIEIYECYNHEYAKNTEGHIRSLLSVLFS